MQCIATELFSIKLLCSHARACDRITCCSSTGRLIYNPGGQVKMQSQPTWRPCKSLQASSAWTMQSSWDSFALRCICAVLSDWALKIWSRTQVSVMSPRLSFTVKPCVCRFAKFLYDHAAAQKSLSLTCAVVSFFRTTEGPGNRKAYLPSKIVKRNGKAERRD